MTKENKIINTEKQMKDVPMLAAVMALGGDKGLSGAIEDQERAGAQQAARSSVLPTDGLEGYREGGPYSYLGIKVLEAVKDDDIFTHVELPEGWKVVPTSHSMHNDILDEKGRKRASYFYKAAFYDRDAQMYPPLCRYRTQFGPNHSYGSEVTMCEIVVMDNTLNLNPITEPSYAPDPKSILGAFRRDRVLDEKAYKVIDELKAKATAWLEENYPDYKNHAAYWEDE